MKRIEFAVIQPGGMVFGTGETPEQAISDAAYWLELDDEYGGRGGFTSKQVARMITVGDLIILHRRDAEFNDYMSDCGFVLGDDNKWYDDED
jgi:hypothetical protein